MTYPLSKAPTRGFLFTPTHLDRVFVSLYCCVRCKSTLALQFLLGETDEHTERVPRRSSRAVRHRTNRRTSTQAHFFWGDHQEQY